MINNWEIFLDRHTNLILTLNELPHKDWKIKDKTSIKKIQHELRMKSIVHKKNYKGMVRLTMLKYYITIISVFMVY